MTREVYKQSLRATGSDDPPEGPGWKAVGCYTDVNTGYSGPTTNGVLVWVRDMPEAETMPGEDVEMSPTGFVGGRKNDHIVLHSAKYIAIGSLYDERFIQVQIYARENDENGMRPCLHEDMLEMPEHDTDEIRTAMLRAWALEAQANLQEGT
jgi:hypothetical protein